MSVVLTDPGMDYACDGFVDQLNGGKIKILDASQNLLVTFTFGTPAFGDSGAVVAGRADANAITGGTAIASGTATFATLHKSDDTKLATIAVDTSGSDLNLDDTAIVSGEPYGLDTFYWAMPSEAT